MFKLLPLDYEIFNLVKPAALTLIITPIVGIINSYLLSRLGSVTILTIQNAANQVFTVTFGFVAFLPLVISPIISKFNSKNENNKIIELMNNSIILYSILGLIISIALFIYSSYFLSFFISIDSIFFLETINFLRIKCFIFPIMMINSIITSVLKGMMDFKSDMRNNIKTQFMNIFCDLILINLIGINGAAISSVLSELFCFYGNLRILRKREMIKFTNSNFFPNIWSLLKNGFFVQIRSTVGNFNYYYLNKQISIIDKTGLITAAHILSCRVLEILSISFSSLSSVSPIIIAKYNSDQKKANVVIKRFLEWAFIVTIIQTMITYFSYDLISYFTNELFVLNQIYSIIPLIVIYSSISGFSLIIDGILQGKNEFKLQTYLSFISLTVVYFLIGYCYKLIHIWYLITLIFCIRVPLNIYFLSKK